MPQPKHVALLALCALLGVSPDARAGAAAKLTYVRDIGAERCADEGELRQAVAARVGYDLFFPWAQKTVVVEIGATRPSGYRGVIQIVDEHGIILGQRSLDSKSDDCADLVRALALAISIAVDDRSLEYVPPPAADASAAEVRRSDEPLPAPPAPLPEPSAVAPALPAMTQALSFSAWVTPLVTIDSAPSPALGVEVEAVASYGIASLGLGIRADAPAPVTVPAGGSVTTWLVAAAVAPCLRGPLRLSYCALGMAGWFAADGHVVRSNDDGEAFAAAGGRLGFDAPLGHRFLFVSHVDALAALTRFDVRVGGASVFRVPPASVALGAGLGMVF